VGPFCCCRVIQAGRVVPLPRPMGLKSAGVVVVIVTEVTVAAAEVCGSPCGCVGSPSSSSTSAYPLIMVAGLFCCFKIKLEFRDRAAAVAAAIGSNATPIPMLLLRLDVI